MNRESGGDPIAMGNLGHVTVGKRFALQSFHYEKAMHVPFGVAHGDLRCRRQAMLDKRDTNQQHGKPARGNCFHHSMILIDNNRQLHRARPRNR
jgi:hypothetical protein